MKLFIFMVIPLILINGHRNLLLNRTALLVNLINSSANTTWQASDKFVNEVGVQNLRKRLGIKNWSTFDNLKSTLAYRPHHINIDENLIIPDFFDARKKWPRCSSISHIRDQGNCGNCWAQAGCSAFSDRLCIASGQKLSIKLSTQQVTFCCEDCGDGCNGGYIEDTWNYFKEYGVVTGGDYNSNEGCQPYEIPPLDHPGSWFESDPDQQVCVQNKCTNSKYKIPFRSDLHYTRNVYVVPAYETAIQMDILINGPVQAGFDVYEDFYFYSTGIYRRNRVFPYKGGHAVKIIGWGVESVVVAGVKTAIKYWIASNSWGKMWGERGTFRIVRGQDECLIENRIIAGLVKS